jgi:hypothetical protein
MWLEGKRIEPVFLASLLCAMVMAFCVSASVAWGFDPDARNVACLEEDWKPVDSQVLVDAWDEIKDCAEGIQKDLACPDETISKMLRSVAETFDNTVEDILDKAEEDWEEDK